MKKKGILIAIIILAIGFATVSTTLVLNGTIGVGADLDDYDIIFTSAKIGNINQTIKKTNKTADTIEFDVLLNKVGEAKTLEYTVKNNSTQYEANANMKCYALNDTDELMTKYITISGELAGKTVTFAQVIGNAVLSDEINFKAQESKNGTITMSLKKSYAGDDEISVTLKCEIITNADSSDEVKDKVIPVVYPTAGLYDADDNLLCEWDTCGIDVSYTPSSNPARIKSVIETSYPTAVKAVVKEGITEIGYESFNSATTLTDVILPNTVTKIGEWAFDGCTNLTNIKLSDNLSEIGGRTFSGTNISELTIPGGVKTVSKGIFSGMSKLKKVVFSEGVETLSNNIFDGNRVIENVVIPSTVTAIPSMAFRSCKNLTSVTIPDTLTSIGIYAFEGSGLTSVKIPGGVKEIEQYAFYYCESLTDVVIEEGVEIIAWEAFTGSGIVNLRLPSTITTIEDYAFQGLTNLTGTVVLDNVKTIGNCAFMGDSNITGLSLNNVETIGDNTFNSCSSLTGTINLPNVKSIGNNAFYYASNITDITINENAEIIRYGAFKNVPHITYYGTLTEDKPWGALSIN